jgi:hypothetical protein
MSLHVMLPNGDSEPVALPSSGGSSGSPPPDPVREYVTLTELACRVSVAQKFRAKTQAAAGRRNLGFMMHFLSVFRFQASERRQLSTSKKLVVKPLLTAKFLPFDRDSSLP